MNHENDAPRTGLATSRLRMWGYAAILTAMAFSQSAGRIVADTKFDLLTRPAEVPVQRAAAVGPHRGVRADPEPGLRLRLADGAVLPARRRCSTCRRWVIQRLWWALLLCLAFFGVVRLAQRLAPRLAAHPGPRRLRVRADPTHHHAARRHVGRGLADGAGAVGPDPAGGRQRARLGAPGGRLSALVVACCGGVNAIAVAAVLPLGVIWILTRAAGPRKWPLLGWWIALHRPRDPVVDGTPGLRRPLLRAVPRLHRERHDHDGAHRPGALAAGAVGLGRLLRRHRLPGGSAAGDHAVPDAGRGGHRGVRTGRHRAAEQPAPAVPDLGCAHRAGAGRVRLLRRARPASSPRTAPAWLDGPLAALRNLHKFDIVLRIPLVLGLAHVLAVLPGLRARPSARSGASGSCRRPRCSPSSRMVLPWAQDRMAPA